MAQRGFTLIELLVVLALVGLLISLAPAAFQRALPGLELKDAAFGLAEAMRRARGRAIYENRESFVLVDVEARRYRLGTDGSEERVPGNVALKMVTARVEQIDDSRGRIRFFPDGTSTGGSLILSAGERSYEVRIEWFDGRVSVAETGAPEG